MPGSQSRAQLWLCWNTEDGQRLPARVCPHRPVVETQIATPVSGEALGTTILGILIFREPFQWSRIFFVLLIVTGLAGLKLTAPPEEPAPNPTVTTDKG